MHSMKNTVAILLIGVLVGHSRALLGQSIQAGDYFVKHSNDLFESELLQLNDDKTFNCIVFGCNYKLLGQGRYEVHNDTLSLYFESHPMQRETQRIEAHEGGRNKTTINIRVHSARSESVMAGVNCLLKSLQRGTSTDSTGQAQLVIEKLSKTDTLEVYFIGYSPAKIAIQPTFDTVNAWVTLDDLSFYSNGDEAKFKINRIKKNSFGLQRLENLELTYQKISAKQKRELVKWIE